MARQNDRLTEFLHLKLFPEQLYPSYDKKNNNAKRNSHQLKLVFMQVLYRGQIGIWIAGFVEGGKPGEKCSGATPSQPRHIWHPAEVKPGLRTSMRGKCSLHCAISVLHNQNKKSIENLLSKLPQCS